MIALVLGLGAVHALRSVDLSSLDARFAIRGPEKPSNVVVVGIDQTTFNDLRSTSFPLPRRLDAQVIANLARAGARVIAVDLEFDHPSDVPDDNALIRAVRAAGHVVLSTIYVGAGGSTPIFGGGAGLRYSRGVPGEAQLPFDADGVFRRMPDQVGGLPAFAIATAQLASGRPVAFPGGRNATAPIDFAGPSGTVTEIPFSRVLADRFAPTAVHGKIAVIGAVASDLGDIHATATGTGMSGAEVQANAIETALRGFPLRFAPGWLGVALVIAFGLAAPMLALRLPVLAIVAVTALAIVLLALATQLAFNGGVIVGFVYPALAAVLAAAATFALQGRRLRALEAELPSPVVAFFISHRRLQSDLAANMLAEGLTRRFGRRRVFMDTQTIESGDVWPSRIDEALASCGAVLVVIGPGWLEAKASDGSRRIDDPRDWVRREIELALADKSVTVVPVFHDGAAMPSRDQLPESLGALTDLQGIVLTGRHVDRWIDALTRSIDATRVQQMNRAPAEQPARS
ncbi:MAG: CHASE2 domain-containing protein [Solirubrobacteraceae bacterium]